MTGSSKSFMTEVRVGFLFLLVITIIMVSLFLVRSKTDLLEPHFSFTIQFPQVQGLKLGAPVQLAGVRIGEVKNIAFPTSKGEQSVLVDVEVKKSVRARILDDALIYIDSPSLLSEKNVQITFGTPEGKPIKEGAVVRGLAEKP